jgi:hypothetical protein
MSPVPAPIPYDPARLAPAQHSLVEGAVGTSATCRNRPRMAAFGRAAEARAVAVSPIYEFTV